jgi:hypothetical protein
MKIKLSKEWLLFTKNFYLARVSKNEFLLLTEEEKKDIAEKMSNDKMSRFIIAGMLPVVCKDGEIEVDDKFLQNITGEPNFAKETIGTRVTFK